MANVDRKPRMRCMLSAEISFAKGAFCYPCTLREVSETGAKLSVSQDIAIPEVFELKIPKRPMVAGGVIRWRQGNEIGISFLMAGSGFMELNADLSAEEQRDLALAENVRLSRVILDLNMTIETLRKRMDLIVAHEAMKF